MGEIDKTKAIVQHLLEIDPNYTLDDTRRIFPYQSEDFREIYFGGLDKVGPPRTGSAGGAS